MGSVLGLLLKIKHHGIHGIRKEHSNSLPQLPERKSVSLTTLEASLPMALSSGKVENRLTLATDCLLTGYKKIFFSYWQLHSWKGYSFHHLQGFGVVLAYSTKPVLLRGTC